MPQLDIGTFFLQFSSIILSLIFFYGYFVKYLLPEIFLSIIQRKILIIHFKRNSNLIFSFILFLKNNLNYLKKLNLNFFLINFSKFYIYLHLINYIAIIFVMIKFS